LAGVVARAKTGRRGRLKERRGSATGVEPMIYCPPDDYPDDTRRGGPARAIVPPSRGAPPCPPVRVESSAAACVLARPRFSLPSSLPPLPPLCRPCAGWRITLHAKRGIPHQPGVNAVGVALPPEVLTAMSPAAPVLVHHVGMRVVWCCVATTTCPRASGALYYPRPDPLVRPPSFRTPGRNRNGVAVGGHVGWHRAGEWYERCEGRRPKRFMCKCGACRSK